MPFTPPTDAPRCAVVDLGSNSVRLVVFEGRCRNPLPIFNEKAVLRLGRGLQDSGELNPDGVTKALAVMRRYHALARAMGAAPFEVLATSAVRDARNGPAFVAGLSSFMPDVPIHVLSGAEEALLSAEGVLGGIPAASGILADIGGGSLELVRLERGATGAAETLRLGVIRLADRAGGDVARARAIAEADLASVPWLGGGAGEDLFLVGGAWRALARIHMAQTAYPLGIVHHYTISREEARDLAGVIAMAGRRGLDRMPGVPRRRAEDLPFAAAVLRRLLRITGARRVIFSANGLREGWYLRQLPLHVRAADPMREGARELAARFGRDPALPPALAAWTAPLFPDESETDRQLREAAVCMSDTGSHDHPEFRAEQAFLRILRQPGIGLDHHARAFLALAVALRYDADMETGFVRPARLLLDEASARRAGILGTALRLAYMLSGGTPDLLAATGISVKAGRLVLRLEPEGGVFISESVTQRLEQLARAMGLEPETRLLAA